jgi:hypothetical protein
MSRTVLFEHEFVENVPCELAPDKLYISIRYRTASHLCACGCGRKVVTPIKPAKWKLTYNGDTVSLWPSIGRWQLPCKSHYIIRQSRVVWARAFSDEEAEAVRHDDADDLRRYYEDRSTSTNDTAATTPPSAPPESLGVWRTIVRGLKRRTKR